MRKGNSLLSHHRENVARGRAKAAVLSMASGEAFVGGIEIRIRTGIRSRIRIKSKIKKMIKSKSKSKSRILIS
jgi:hypothetical protein